MIEEFWARRGHVSLQPIVLTVRPPKIPGIDREELQAEALIHLLTVSMRSLGRVMADPSAYFAVAVMNFYRDKLEGVQRERKRDLKRRRYADEVMDDVETAEDLDHIGG
jgi:hypothetical protein